jgi:hypothetical protein
MARAPNGARTRAKAGEYRNDEIPPTLDSA